MAVPFVLELLPEERSFGFTLTSNTEPGIPYLIVSKVEQNSPAYRAGIRQGERVLTIEYESVVRKKVSDVRQLIKETGETTRKLTVICLRVPSNETIRQFRRSQIKIDKRESAILICCIEELKNFVDNRLNNYMDALQQLFALDQILARAGRYTKAQIATAQRDRQALLPIIDKLLPNRQAMATAFKKVKLMFMLLTRLRQTLISIDRAGIFDVYVDDACRLFVMIHLTANRLYPPDYSLTRTIDCPLFNRETLAQVEEIFYTKEGEAQIIWANLGPAWKVAVEDWDGEIKHCAPNFPPKFPTPLLDLPFLHPHTIMAWRTAYLDQEKRTIAHLRKDPENKVQLDENQVHQVREDMDLMHSLKNKDGSVLLRRGRDYHDLRVLGAGSFGRAVLTERLSDGKKVVIKEIVLEGSAENDTRSRKEAKIMADCKQNFIVAMNCFFEENNSLYIEMEYCSKGTLQSKIEIQRTNRAAFPESDFRRWTTQLSRAVEYLHKNNVIHRDLKPANIFLAENNNVKLGDLGAAAKLNEAGKTARNASPQTIIGTYAFMAPEVLLGKPYGTKVDIWSLGVVFYYMASLQLPFGGAMASIARILSGERAAPLPLPPYSENTALFDLIIRMLSGDVNERLNIEQVLDTLPEVLN